MLCLSRKPNEWVDIVTKSGERIAVCVRRSDGRIVRLGFEADDSTRIVRRELGPPLARQVRQRKESA